MVMLPATDDPGIHPAEPGYIGRIPVRNLWLLMLYASDLFRVIGSSSAGVEDRPDDLPDLVAEILAHSVERRQRRQLTRGYMRREGILGRVRGRIDVLNTERHQLLSRGSVACIFDELTVDTPRNRYVRSALESISRLVQRKDLAHRCRTLAAGLKSLGVKGEGPDGKDVSILRFGRHESDDRVMVTAAKLAFELALPNEMLGQHALPMPDREEVWVRRLFERAIGGFYSVKLRAEDWKVKTGSPLDWHIEGQTGNVGQILPNMRTDIILDHRPTGQRIVIDTKFTSIVTRGWRREDTLRSHYVYQMYSYLRSQSGRNDAASDNASGLLLHPSIGEDVDEAVVIQGHRIRFATVDLTLSPSAIAPQLMRRIDMESQTLS